MQGTDLGERIVGLAGNDVINGKAGNDSLVGGLGKDNLTGGAGADAFVFESLDDRGDTIRDWEMGIDAIDLSQVFSAPQFSGFSDSMGRFDNYVQFRLAPMASALRSIRWAITAPNLSEWHYVRNVTVADLSIGDLRLT